MKFIHITDIHLVSPNVLLHGLDPARRFARCLDDIKRNHSDAECCVITGDLADKGEESAYQFLFDQITNLGIQCHLILGNHDHRGNFLKTFAKMDVDEHGFIQYTIRTSAGVFVIIDTLESGTSSGIYCEHRSEWLRDTLKQNSDESVFLFMHHPPFDLGFSCIDKIGLTDQRNFAEIVRPYANIRHLFFGHAHRPISGNWQGISFSSLRGTNHQVALDFKSEEINYADEPPEYSIVLVSDDQVIVHTHMFPLEINE